MDTQILHRAQTLIEALDPTGSPTAQFFQHAKNHIQLPAKRLGVLDASFNPLTHAHEALAEYAQQAFAFDERVLLLAKTNVDKDIFGANLAQRLTMLAAYAGDRFSIAGCSHARFIDKANALSGCLPDHTQIYFIVGHDTLVRIFDPHYYTDMATELHALFSLCHIISANRAEQGKEAFDTFMQHPQRSPFQNRVHPLELPPSFGLISSTQVRKRIQEGKQVNDLVPKAIAHCIASSDLYR